MKVKDFTKTWMYGLTIFVLVVIAGILTGISIIPVTAIAMALQGGYWLVYALSLFISIYFLGWVFGRFKVHLKR